MIISYLLSNLKPPAPLPSSYWKGDCVFYLRKEKQSEKTSTYSHHHSSPSACAGAVDPAASCSVDELSDLSEGSYVNLLLLCNITTNLTSENNTHLSLSLWDQDSDMSQLSLVLQGLTRLQSRCWPGLWTHLRLRQGRIRLQACLVVGSIQFLVSAGLEASCLKFLATWTSVWVLVSSKPAKERASCKTGIRISCNIIMYM